jgi:HK97 family phage major capsid protein
MTYAEQRAGLDARRASSLARMKALNEESVGAGSTMDASQKEEFETLEKDVEAIDGELKRVSTLERFNIEQAVEVRGASAVEGSESRSVKAYPQVRVDRKGAAGIGFTRYVMAVAQSKGNLMQAHQIAKGNERWMAETPDVEAVLKSAINAGTTTDSTWASPLTVYQNLVGEFIEYLRPQTIIGRLNLRPVPFKVKVPRQTAGASVGWVGEGQVRPVSKLAFDQVTLDIANIGGIVVITKELARHSSPSAEMLVRDDLGAALIQFMDSQFVDPSVASTGSSPASVTNGVSGIVSTGNDSTAFRTDTRTLMQQFVSNNLGLADGAWIMTQQQALAIGMMLNSLGQPLYPTIDVNGGTLFGLPVIASENIPSTDGSPADGVPIILVKQRDILLADDGQVTIDASQEASLQMDTSPDSPTTGSTNLVSLWQQGMLGIKAEREINWVKRRSTSVGLITSAHYS